MIGGEKMMNSSRKPRIMADAAHWILTRPSDENTGRFFIDEAVLRNTGVEDFESYAVKPGVPLTPDFFI
jgi:citronellol/citronellal dehydrogenase